MALAIILILLALLVLLAKGGKRRASPTRTELQKQDDELITVILPTINNDK